jgi:hypothetical protein
MRSLPPPCKVTGRSRPTGSGHYEALCGGPPQRGCAQSRGTSRMARNVALGIGWHLQMGGGWKDMGQSLIVYPEKNNGQTKEK